MMLMPILYEGLNSGCQQFRTSPSKKSYFTTRGSANAAARIYTKLCHVQYWEAPENLQI